MDRLALSKCTIILVNGLWMRAALTPPNAHTPPEKRFVPDWRERFTLAVIPFHGMFKMMYWLAGLVEVLAILATSHPDFAISRSILRLLHASNIHQSKLIGTLQPFFVIGTLMMWLGGSLRLYAYRTLGRHFTFQLAIHPDHVLVDYGPYSIVRHPSYTGLIMLLAGAFVSNVEGSWVRESGILDYLVVRLLLAGWVLVLLGIVVSLVLRVTNEDRLMKGEFEKEWVAWAKKVPYRLIPLVY
ncbi:hypothetical protein CC1G_13260 [Coprinopsis cinerea okayama7|uniref:Protein-S-isoprenylcysteine O-methyltransferase n=1 Tax=Coprinopsis cinerea (strain Okayama-7 / 130 / ATCC MYA-4618 / FGSC 9003) TaxID=240176 RepID=A8PI74_COPC7|nr:hypothetical protein CC1G_13260 [Coprinopsis cinerea okayama7\|eukprot:XP_001841528.1 hypothetical protein CC1G_13260 [Coprinopsis cinerea okayama7\